MDGRGKNVREVKRTRLKLADKNRSLELLGKHLKLFTERVEVSALEGLPERLDEAMKRKNAPISQVQNKLAVQPACACKENQEPEDQRDTYTALHARRGNSYPVGLRAPLTHSKDSAPPTGISSLASLFRVTDQRRRNLSSGPHC